MKGNMTTQTTPLELTHFKVSHWEQPLGTATLLGNSVRFKADAESCAYLEAQQHGWLTALRTNVAELCRSVGHYGKYFSSHDTETGVCVERQS